MMGETTPPLPELEISEAAKRNTDQLTVDTALGIIYERRPDIFRIFARKERDNQNLGEDGNDFHRLLRDEVWNYVPKPWNLTRASISILLEGRRRARLMYGMPPDRP